MDRRVESRWAAILVIVLLAGTGACVAMGQWLPVVAVLAPCVVGALIFLPSARTTIVLASSSSFVFVWAYPYVSVGSANIFLGEAALFAVVIATLLGMARDKGALREFRDPVSGFVALYSVGVVLGVVVAFMNRTHFSDVVWGARSQIFVAAFLTFRYALRRPVWRTRVLVGAGILGSIVAAFQAAQVALGSRITFFVLGTFTDLIETDQATGFLRVRPPGLYLEYVVACVSAAYLIWGPKRARVPVAVMFALTFAGVLLSFNRNMLIGFVVGLLIAGIFSRRRERLVGGVAVGVTVLLLLVIYFGGGASSNPLVARFATLADPAARAAALQDRLYETGFALAAVLKSPVIGIGWGTQYGASATRRYLGVVAARSRDWLHNQYLAAWLRMGLIGLVAFLGIVVTTLVAGARAARIPDQSASWLGPATMAAGTALAVSALVDLVILSPSDLPVFAFVAALASYLWSTTRDPEQAGDVDE